ncbi:hypothetical protein L7F22_012128 [Adiantum nelumboides]|nr:hypothetical protein [Adiantum nelumboides]
MAFLVSGRDDEATKLRAFPLVLREGAKAWYQTLAPEERRDWETLKMAFIEEFCHQESSEEIWRQLLELRQTSPNDYRSYEGKFFNLWEKWCASLGEGERPPECLKKDCFLAGLYPILQEKLQGGMEPPLSAQPIARTVAGTSATDQESSQQELLQQITNQLESLSINLVQGVRAPQSGNDRNRQEGQRQTQEYVCYNCGEVGHGMYFCPHPRRYQGNGNHRQAPRQQVTPPRARPPNGQQNAPVAPPIQILRPPPPLQTPAKIPPLPSGGEDRAVSVISSLKLVTSSVLVLVTDFCKLLLFVTRDSSEIRDNSGQISIIKEFLGYWFNSVLVLFSGYWFCNQRQLRTDFCILGQLWRLVSSQIQVLGNWWNEEISRGAQNNVALLDVATYGLKVYSKVDAYDSKAYGDLWPFALTTVERGKVPRGKLSEAGNSVQETTRWYDPVDSLSIYAYIAKSNANEAMVEEKRKRDEETLGTSKRATTSRRRKEEGTPPKPTPEVYMEDAPPKDKKQGKPRGPSYKLKLDIELATNLKKVFEERILNSKDLQITVTDALTYGSILKACAVIGAIEMGKQIHDEIVKQGLLEHSVKLSGALVDMYAKYGVLLQAHSVLEKLPSRDVVVWSSLGAGYAEKGYGQQALHSFEQMQLEGIPPNAVTYTCILKVCAFIGDIDKGKQLHDEILRQGLVEHDIVLGNALVDMYARCGALSQAQSVLEEFPSRDSISWSSLIAGYLLLVISTPQEDNILLTIWKILKDKWWLQPIVLNDNAA